MMGSRIREVFNHLKTILFYIGVITIVVMFCFPFIWMVFSSFKPNVELMNLPPRLVSNFTIDNYKSVFLETAFLSRLANSFIVSFMAVAIGLLLGLPAAYSIARYKFKTISFGILISRMIPGISFLIPWFIIYRKIGLIDTFTGLIISHLVLTLPIIIWIMIGFFEDIPQELEEAARIDGCNVWMSFYKIAVPLCRPGIATASILAFIFSWNHFLFALILSGTKTSTLPVIVFQFMAYEEINFGGLYAAATLITLPIIVLVLMIQNQFISGLTMGGVKE